MKDIAFKFQCSPVVISTNNYKSPSDFLSKKILLYIENKKLEFNFKK
jgi:hypothetical protein